MSTVSDRMKALEWGGVVPTTMTIHDVPFTTNPLELVPTETELQEQRSGFDVWFENITPLIQPYK